jgi:hypothetical protein
VLTETHEICIASDEAGVGRRWVFHALGRDLTERRISERTLRLLAEHRHGLLHSDESWACGGCSSTRSTTAPAA